MNEEVRHLWNYQTAKPNSENGPSSLAKGGTFDDVCILSQITLANQRIRTSVENGRDLLLTKENVHGPHRWPRSPRYGENSTVPEFCAAY